MATKYSQDTINFILSSYPELTPTEIAKKLGKSPKCISEFLRNRGRSGEWRKKDKLRKRSREYYEYSSWSSMITRCENPNILAWEYYGGRGIKVCDRWKNSFFDFLKDMGQRPIGTSIDRIDPNGNYEPLNCRWATSKEQSETTRRGMPIKTCKICSGLTNMRSWDGRCHKCNEYFRRNKIERPPAQGRVPVKITPPKECINCGKFSKPRSKERCITCYNYLLRTGRDRTRLSNKIS